MRMRLGLVAVVAGLAGWIAGGGTLATASPTADESAQTFRLHEFVIKTILLQEKPGTNSPGDQVIFHSVLKTGAGETVGVSDYSCLILNPSSSGPAHVVGHCTGTVTFTDHSTIEFSGAFNNVSNNTTLALIGGTGRYSAIEGQVFVKSLNGAAATKLLDTFKVAG